MIQRATRAHTLPLSYLLPGCKSDHLLAQQTADIVRLRLVDLIMTAQLTHPTSGTVQGFVFVLMECFSAISELKVSPSLPAR